MATPTNNPVPSADANDFAQNVEQIDIAVNGAPGAKWRNRLTGEEHMTLADAVQDQATLALNLANNTDPAKGAGMVGGAARVVDVEQWGCALDGITDCAAQLASANAFAVSHQIPLSIRGPIHVGSPVTITTGIVDGLHQMFSATSAVTINNGLPVRPDWWGDVEGAVRYAINALPSTGGTVQLEAKTYKPNGYRYGFGGTGVAITKDNVTILGRKMPTFTNNCKALTGGTIIQGQFGVYANNFEMRDVGIDSGKTVLETYYSDTAQAGVTEALGISYPDDATKASNALRTNIRLHNIISLASSPTDPVHGIIVGEGVADVVCTGDIIGMYGVHGVVIKCRGVVADNLRAYCNGEDGLIIKSDTQTTARAERVNIKYAEAHASGPAGFSPYAVSTTGTGYMLRATGGSVDQVYIGEFVESGYPVAHYKVFDGGYSISSCGIGLMRTDGYGVPAESYGVLDNSNAHEREIVRCRIDQLESRNRAAPFVTNCYANSVGAENMSFGNINAYGTVNTVRVGNTAIVSIGSVSANGCTDAVYRLQSAAKIKVGMLSSANIAAVYSTSSGGSAPALASGWTQIAENDVFGVDLSGGRVHLRGLIQPTAASTIFASLPTWARPTTVKRFVAQGIAAGASHAVPVVIGSDGFCAVNEVGGGVANCSTWLSLDGISWDVDD